MRFGTPTGITIRAAVQQSQDKVAITLPRSIVQEYGLQPGAHEAVAQIGGMPAVEGPLRLWARLGDDGPTVRWSQIVLP